MKSFFEQSSKIITEYHQLQLTENPKLLNFLLLVKSDYLIPTDSYSHELLQSLLIALTEQQPYPEIIVFMDKATALTQVNSPIIKELKRLEIEGVLIFSSQICCQHYGYQSKLAVGELASMRYIANLIKQSKKVLTL